MQKQKLKSEVPFLVEHPTDAPVRFCGTGENPLEQNFRKEDTTVKFLFAFSDQFIFSI